MKAMINAAKDIHIQRLKKREDFLRLRNGRFERRAGFLLQAMPGQSMTTRVGFTCTKKIGNAVTRNRAKRRLRALAAEILPIHGQAGWDYVFIGRPDVTVKRSFDKLCRDAKSALDAIHGVS